MGYKRQPNMDSVLYVLHADQCSIPESYLNRIDSTETLMTEKVKNGEWLKESLERLDWTQKKFAFVMGVSENQVSRWVKGTSPVPQYATKYVEVMLKIKGIVDG